ncbi:uncharacterized protein LOC122853842 [Aphidius gifuensis]|uniref:uncharacterized protein LOC122853842 n=1 Tax=Aphidius gifuensis TaxID=684658 RepID=UPI001CDBA8B0|nr:uncharacterized protein LOC122853842 [Aphidius gifuensis]
MVDESVLAINSSVQFDESISHYEIHAHQPYGSSSFNNSDEIRITIQNQDLFILPSKSFLHISGKLSKKNTQTAPTKVKLVHNAMCHMFDEIRYEINGIEVDKSKNVGVTSTIKNYLSINASTNLENAGWMSIDENVQLTNDDGYFDVCIPLKMLLGFAEDYKKIIVNAKHEIILIRSRNDINSIIPNDDTVVAEEQIDINIMKIEWLIPYVMLSNKQKIEMMKYIQKDPLISIGFRSWELYEYPLLPRTNKHIWTIKTASQLEKPRYVILVFQTNRKNQWNKNANNFDHCNISDVKLHLNSQIYPYGNLNLDINKNQFALLYEMYANFSESYYGNQQQFSISKEIFKSKLPFIVIDCSRQNEMLKSGPVDVRLEFESKENFPADTSAYCLIIHDRILEYKPISGIIRKLI